MLRSMTGFGSALGEIEGVNGPVAVRVEARAVNHRFLQVKVRLPPELSFLEGPVEERAKKKFDRGSLAITISFARATAFQDVALNVELAQRWISALERTARELQLGEDGRRPSLEFVVGLPGVIGGEIDESRIKKSGKAVLAIVDDALAALVEMRAHEGAALTKELGRLAAEIEKLRAKIGKAIPAVVERHRQMLESRVNELLGPGRSVDPADLAREVALLADRLDVTEELVRLDAHGAQLSKLIEKGGAVGRRLDFLVQEFHREANTIGSKSSDAGVAHLVVDLKTAIERLREQVQNIE